MFSPNEAGPSIARPAATQRRRAALHDDSQDVIVPPVHCSWPGKNPVAIGSSSGQLSTDDPVTPSPRRVRHAGVSRTRSDSVLVSPAGWSPSSNRQAAPIARVESKTGRGIGTGTGTVKEELESGLSRVYVQAEKVPLAPRRASDVTRNTGGRAGWRRGLVEGAYSAGVVGAALGLTAYRLISTRARPAGEEDAALKSQSEVTEDTLSGQCSYPTPYSGGIGARTPTRLGSTPSSPSPVTPAMEQRLPPPAYDELLLSEEDCIDEDDLPASAGAHSHSRICSRQRSAKTRMTSENDHCDRSFFTPTRKRPSKARHTKSRHSARSSLSRLSNISGASFEIVTPGHSSRPSGSSLPARDISTHVLKEGDAGPRASFNDRLDEMTLRLQQLISEGQAALVSPAHPSLEHWADEMSD